MNIRQPNYSAGKRLKAFALDYLVIAGYLILLGASGWAVVSGPWGASWERSFSSPWHIDVLAFFTAVLPVGVYFTVFESSSSGATLGKRVMGLRVVRTGGGRLGLWRSALRSAGKLLPWQIAHTSMLHIPGWPTNPQTMPLWSSVGLGLTWLLVGTYILTLLVRTDRRTPYDSIAGSKVISVEGDLSGSSLTPLRSRGRSE